MAVNVETLEKLERKMTLTLPMDAIQNEVDARLRKLSRTVKMDGFRPGKVPMGVVAQRYGYSVQYEVMNDKVGEAFQNAASEAKLRVAGQPSISEKEGAPEGQMAFDAVFEVFPDVKLGDLTAAEVEKVSVDVGDDAIERTLDILRKQRRSFAQRAQGTPAEDGDRVTVDFAGKIDGEPFEGGKAEDFQFVIAEGQMLKEFEDAVRGMKSGESKTFPMAFPADYHGADVAGKTADFLVTVKKIEAAHLPEVNEQLAKSLGVAEGTVEALRADIRKNLEREVSFRVTQRNKQAVMAALVKSAELDVPNALVKNEVARMIETARADLKSRGIKDVEKLPIPEDTFLPEAERRVRTGLVVAELVSQNDLQATPDQVKTQVETMAASYERPEEVVRYYFADANRLAEMQAVATENNVTEFVLGKAKVTDKQLGFEELMGQQG